MVDSKREALDRTDIDARISTSVLTDQHLTVVNVFIAILGVNISPNHIWWAAIGATILWINLYVSDREPGVVRMILENILIITPSQKESNPWKYRISFFLGWLIYVGIGTLVVVGLLQPENISCAFTGGLGWPGLLVVFGK